MRRALVAGALAAVVAAVGFGPASSSAEPGSPDDRFVRRFAGEGIVRVDERGTATRGAGAGEAPAARSSAGGDPDLEPGFPVTTYARGGTYHAGPAINVLVTNIDSDSSLEMCATALSVGPMYCWQHTGAVVPGWGQAQAAVGAGYAGLGFPVSSNRAGLVIGHFGDLIAARSPSGNPLPGWPIDSSNFVTSPPTLARFGGGQPVALIGEEDWALHSYRRDATIPTGWPSAANVGGQERHTPGTANVDGTRSVEIFTASGWTSPGVYLFGLRADGTTLPGYPVLFQGEVDTYPAIGDVDADGALEVVVVGTDPTNPLRSALIVFTAATGQVEGIRVLSGQVPYGTAPALADLDQQCSGLVEIVVQTENSIDVVRWNGSSFTNYPGWPRTWGVGRWIGDSSPVVGDVDGDGLPDIVFTGQVAGNSVDGFVYAYSRAGL
ncbi:MAG: FG-GAP repeat domain-containing protein, partial [Actinomycetota bacterium]